MGKIQNFVDKLHLDRYFSSRLILAIDLFISLSASICSLMFIKTLLFRSLVTIDFILVWLSASLVMSFIMFYMLKTYRSIIRHSTLREFAKLCLASFGKVVFMGALVMLLPYGIKAYIFFLMVLDLILTIVFLLLVRVAMIVMYDILRNKVRDSRKRLNVMVYGSDEKAVAIVKRLQSSPHYSTIGYLEYGQRLRGQRIDGLKIFYFERIEDITLFRERFFLDGILFPREIDVKKEEQRLLEYCQENNVKVLVSPSIDEVVDGKVMSNSIREVKIEDLLGRDEIKISMDEIKANFKGKTVMVTGAAGSIGSELCRQIATFGVERLILFDNGETPMHNLRLELEERFPYLSFVPVIGDVRLEQRLDYAFRLFRPQIVFHAAAYKHVPLMEENPCEAVLVNAIGSRNVADKCIQYDVEKMVMISTDKAVNPTNVMGCTKRLAEIYVQSLGLALERGEVAGKTKFVTTRFGNVLGSNGSVIPRFREQIAKGGPVTVTHPDIVRFFMTIPEACRLVMEAATMSTGNQIFVFDMGQSVKIDALARKMITLAGLEPDKDILIEYTGLRPGEKLYEEVLANSENTVPTGHDRIRVAKVREYEYADAKDLLSRLEHLSRAVNIPDMIRLMKKNIPEYVSKNSKFEQFDAHNNE
ncbi:MAG: polysaccharide biosynthesis protein [Bacteroidales bacterium]|nr:polysaccharide biosynthesis protein [Bacteroidales bacterium]MBQ8811336.1 polysaccharide biosynthesis protein [Bacteroidales bacterium]